ncbi:hypothetical protein [Streptomyces sp. NPDC005283]|uniref:hypothetical protein n=1 Tax=Streptomyces sp. NPDC005283 TaxID=3156871 RepID=UPI0034559DA2
MKADDTASGSPVDGLRALLWTPADPVRAGQQRAYLHSDLNHLGVRAPDQSRRVTETRRRPGTRPGSDVLALAQDPWFRLGGAMRVGRGG